MKSIPSDLIDPQAKGAKWVEQMAKHIWDNWNGMGVNSFYGGLDRYQKNRLYSLGKQSNAKYLKVFNVDEDTNETFANIDASIVPVIPKFRRIVNERNGSIEFEAKADAIDPLALKDRKEYEAEEYGKIKVREMLSELNYESPILDTKEVDQPKTEEELAIKMEYAYKHNDAIAIEKRIDAVFADSKIEEVRRKIRENLFDYGIAGTKDWTDPVTGQVLFRAVDPKNLILSYTEDPNFGDVWYVGEVVLKTIDQIRRDAKGSIPEDKLEEVAGKYAGKHENPHNYGSNTPYNKAYDSFKVPVLELSFLTVNREVYERRVDRRGNVRFGRTRFNNQNRKSNDKRQYTVDDNLVWFETNWIVNSDVVYNYGVVSDQKKRPSQLWHSLSSYTLCAPELNEMETIGMTDHLIPIADAVMVAWLKLQNVIAQARPKGIMIEMGALEDVELGEGGEAFEPLELLDLFNQTGTLVYRRINLSGEASNYRPIEELNNGLGTEAAEYFGVIDRYFNFLRSITGFNEVTDGSAPDPRMLNGVAGLADQSTNNAIKHLSEAERSIVERLAESVAIRVLDSIVLKKSKYYDNILGASGVEDIRKNRDSIHRELGIHLSIRGDQAEREELSGDVEKSIQAGQITIADKVAVKNIKNTKQAELLLAYRVKENIKNTQASEDAKMERNGQIQQESARIAEEEKRKTLQEAMAVEEAKIAAKMKADIAVMEKEFELKQKLRLFEIENPERPIDSDKSAA